MKIAVWRTGHPIADTVAEAVYLSSNIKNISFFPTDGFLQDHVDEYDCHIGYGILRGMDEVFRTCDRAGKPWFNIDKGYWKPGHYDGYYRVSLRGTQQTTSLDKLEPDYARWDALGIEIFPSESIKQITGYIRNSGDYNLVCPPTEAAANFFCPKGLPIPWNKKRETVEEPKHWKTRDKSCSRSLQGDLDGCYRLFTFNSSVGWEALRQGIPVISDPNHSIIGAYVKQFDVKHEDSLESKLHSDSNARRRLFSVMAGLQLTLEEMRSGLLWPLMNRLLSTSASTAGKP